MKRLRWNFVVLTEGRVFLFGNCDLAEKFARRARRLPSQQGKEVNGPIAAHIFTGRKVTNPASLRKARDDRFAAEMNAKYKNVPPFCSW